MPCAQLTEIISDNLKRHIHMIVLNRIVMYEIVLCEEMLNGCTTRSTLVACR